MSAKIEAHTALVQATFKELSGSEATDEQIKKAGSEVAEPKGGLNTGAPEVSATDTALMKMKSLTSNKGSCEKVI